MPDLKVDVDGLDALATRLEAVTQGMENARARVRRVASDVGDDAVQRAVERFDDHWDDGLERLTSDGEVLTSMLRESASTYRDTDQGLADGLTTQAGRTA